MMLLLLTTITPVCAVEFEQHDNIREAVNKFLVEKSQSMSLNDINIKVSQLDSRLKLIKCQQALKLSTLKDVQPGNVSVAVQCTSAKPWKIYIQSAIQAWLPVYVARNAIARESELSAANVVIQKRNVTSLRGNYITSLDQIQGNTSRRQISAGSIIQLRMLNKSKMVKRGQQVTIIAETSGIRVKMTGKALNDATKGDSVRVKNTKSKRIVEGIAINRGVVKIQL